MDIATSANVHDIIGSHDRVVVYFWGTLCVPCKTLAPIMEAIATENPDIKFVKINVEQNFDLVPAFSIRAVPLLLFYKNKEAVARLEGRQTRRNIEAKLQELTPNPEGKQS